MKLLQHTIVLSLLALIGVISTGSPTQAVDVDVNSYAAVAFSESTGKYGYAWDHPSRASAERAALSHCRESDAKIVGWVKGGWLALAIGDSYAYGVAWEFGNGASNGVARRRAIAECKKSNQKVVTLICLCSGNYPPEIVK